MAQPICILILGMHRSGTSATAGLLNLAGVPLGKDLIPPTAYNPRGYFEHSKILNCHDRLLERNRLSWDTVFPFPGTDLSGLQVKEFLAEIQDIMQDEFAQKSIWGIKNPRMCRFFPVWQQLLGSLDIAIRCLIVIRNPRSVGKSLKVRNGFSMAKSMTLWLDHNLKVERDTRGLQRAFISYERLLAQPVEELSRLIQELNLPLEVPDQEMQEKINLFLDLNLDHGTPVEEIALPGWVRETYDTFIALTEEKSTSRQAVLFKRLDEIHEQFSEAQGLFLAPEIIERSHQLDQLINEHEQRLPLLLYNLTRKRLRGIGARSKDK